MVTNNALNAGAAQKGQARNGGAGYDQFVMRLAFAAISSGKAALFVAVGTLCAGQAFAFAKAPERRPERRPSVVAESAASAAAATSATGSGGDTGPATTSAAGTTGSPAAAITDGTKFSWRAGGAPQLLWTGFRAKPDGGEVLLQTSAEVELTTRSTKDGPVFVLKHCRTLRRTDRLPLDTRYFDSPITRVSLRQHAGDLEIAISLRQPTAAVPRKQAGPAGSWFWVLKFGNAAS